MSCNLRSLPLRSLSLSILSASALAQGAAQNSPGQTHLHSSEPGFRLINVSLDLMAAVGGSSERTAVLEGLQGGGHDPSQRGFTLQQAELGVAGAIDPYFVGEARVTYELTPEHGETQVELEEAFLVTQQLPYGLQVKAGHYLTEFGRVNPTHAHSWHWIDQPIAVTRMLGPEGLRAPGARVAWDFTGEDHGRLLFGAQNASGETVPSFLASDEFYEERAIGGRMFEEQDVRSFGDMLWTGRVEFEPHLDGRTTLQLGASAAFGPNATGGDADTVLYGADFELRCRGEDDLAPQWTLQGELVAREFDAADQVDENTDDGGADDVPIPGETLKDFGGYLQLLYGFGREADGSGWAAGVRGEWVSGSGASYDSETDSFSRADDAFRADRVRVSPLLMWAASPHTRIRLQYNYDDADHLTGDGEAHSVWIGFVTSIGTHPPHTHATGH
ncbi:MAG: hypothetical protein AB7O97_02465 [Planctomycetota bacterium]